VTADLAQRGHDRAIAVRFDDLIVGQRGDLAPQKQVDLVLARRREMQEAGDRLALVHQLELIEKRAGELQQKVGAGEDLFRGVHDRGPGAGVVLVAESGALAGRAFDVDPVSVLPEERDTCRGKPDAVFERTSFERYADVHERLVRG